DLHAPGLGLPRSRRWDGHLENAVTELGGCLRGVRSLGDRNLSVERSVAALTIGTTLALLLPLALPFALDRQPVLADVDLDIILGKPWDVSANDEVTVMGQNIHSRGPLSRDQAYLTPEHLPTASKGCRHAPAEPEIAEEVVHLLGEPPHDLERVVL